MNYTTSCNTESSAPGNEQNNCPKHVELTGIINKPLLLHLVGCLYYLYQWCTVKQISDNELCLLIKYIESVLWRVAKRLSYIQDERCLKVKIAVYSNARTLLLQICLNYFPRHSSVLNILLILYWSLDVRGRKRSGFRPFMIIHINTTVSTLRDCFRQIGMIPRGRRVGFPHSHIVQITLSPVSKWGLLFPLFMEWGPPIKYCMVPTIVHISWLLYLLRLAELNPYSV